MNKTMTVAMSGDFFRDCVGMPADVILTGLFVRTHADGEQDIVMQCESPTFPDIDMNRPVPLHIRSVADRRGGVANIVVWPGYEKQIAGAHQLTEQEPIIKPKATP